MAAVYTVERLGAERIDQAYPLIWAVEPGLTLAQWRHTCNAELCGTPGRAGRTALVVCGASGYLYALCVVKVVRPPQDAPYLAVSKLMIDTAPDPEGVGLAMLQGLSDYATGAGCARLRISILGTDDAALAVLSRARASISHSPLTIEMQ